MKLPFFWRSRSRCLLEPSFPPLFSPPRDETKFIFLLLLLPYWRIEFEKKYQREGRENRIDVFSKCRKIFDFGRGEGINPSPSREPDIWGGGRKSQSHDTRVELSSRSAEKIGGERMVVGGLLNVTSTLASSRLHFSSRLCYEANYAWPQISSSEKLAKLNVANVRKIDLSPLSLYVSFVIFQRVAISTDFSFSQNPKWKRRDRKRENNFFFLFFIFDRDIRYFPFSSRSGRSSLEIFRPVRISREGGGGEISKILIWKRFQLYPREIYFISILYVLDNFRGRGEGVQVIRIRDKLD